MTIVIILLLILVFIGIKFFKVPKISSGELLKLISDQANQNSYLLIDIREEYEYKSGHIADAINIPLSIFGQKVTTLPKDKQIIIICLSGMRGMNACNILKSSGYINYKNLFGGMNLWTGNVVK